MKKCLMNDICRKVAENENVDVTELPPLYHTIDPEALQRFFELVGNQSVTVEFVYAGYKITVSENGIVTANKKHSVGSLQ
jgi:hypothetical protein